MEVIELQINQSKKYSTAASQCNSLDAFLAVERLSAGSIDGVPNQRCDPDSYPVPFEDLLETTVDRK